MKNILLLVITLVFLSSNAHSQSSGSWTQISPPSKPSARNQSVMSRISDTEVLLFGGHDGAQDDETWIFNNTSGSWTQLNPPSKPQARVYSAMSRISDTEVLLFGGQVGPMLNDETWIFNNTSGSWTQLNPPSKPSARSTSVMSQISDTEVLLFGGIATGRNDETWIFNNTSGSWTQLNPPSKPSARARHFMSRISDTEVLLFGGDDGSNDDETWIFNNTSGSWTQLNPPSKPSARLDIAMSRISDNEVLLFGGYDGSNDDETWIFNNSSGSWTQLNPPSKPSARYNTVMSRISDNEVLLFGGYDGVRDDETWIFALDPVLSAPTISNLIINNRTNTSASFTSDLNYGNTSTTVTYEYGTSTGNYSATTTATTIDANQSVSINQSSLTANTEYFVRVRAENSVSFTYSAETSFWTLTDEPTTHTNSFAQVGESNNSITFSFQPLSTIGAEGYLIVKSSQNPADPVDGTEYSVNDTYASTTVVGKITNTAETTFILTGVAFESSAVYKLVPFNIGSDPETLNYFTDNAPTLTAYTVPTLGEWGMISFVGLMAIGGVFYVRKRIA